MKINRTSGVFFLAFVLSCGQEQSQVESGEFPVAKATSLKGRVLLKKADSEKVMAIGDVIQSHDRIVTGPGCTAEILIKGQGLVRIPENTDTDLITLTANLKAQAADSQPILNRLKEDKSSNAHGSSSWSRDIWTIIRLFFVLPVLWLVRGVIHSQRKKRPPGRR